MFYLLYFLRRFLLVFVPFYTDVIVFQITFAVYTALYCSCYLVGVKPLKDRKQQKRETKNDIILLFMNYVCYSFTERYPQNIKEIAGILFSAILWFLLISNVSSLIYDSGKTTFRLLKRKHLVSKQKRKNQLRV